MFWAARRCSSDIFLAAFENIGNGILKRIGKEGVSEDIIRDAEENVQSITNEFTSKIDNIFSSKESDIMQV